jgi:hypothetical protein
MGAAPFREPINGPGMPGGLAASGCERLARNTRRGRTSVSRGAVPAPAAILH